MINLGCVFSHSGYRFRAHDLQANAFRGVHTDDGEHQLGFNVLPLYVLILTQPGVPTLIPTGEFLGELTAPRRLLSMHRCGIPAPWVSEHGDQTWIGQD